MIVLATLDLLCLIMSVMFFVVSRIGFSIRSSSCGIYSWWPLGHQVVPFQLDVQFGVAHSQSLVTSYVELVDDCYVCDDVWPLC